VSGVTVSRPAGARPVLYPDAVAGAYTRGRHRGTQPVTGGAVDPGRPRHTEPLIPRERAPPMRAWTTQDHSQTLTYSRVLSRDTLSNLCPSHRVRIARTHRSRSSARALLLTSRTSSRAARGVGKDGASDHGQTRSTARVRSCDACTQHTLSVRGEAQTRARAPAYR